MNNATVERPYELISCKESSDIRSRGIISNISPNTNFLPTGKIDTTNSHNERISATKEKTSITRQETGHGMISKDDEINQTVSCVINENFYSR